MPSDDFRAHAPALAPLQGSALPPVTRLQLDNGVTVVGYDGCSQPVNMVSVVRKGGNADVGSPALFPMMLATMGEGTSLHTGTDIANIIDSNGSWLKTGAYGHHSVVSIFSLNSRTAQVMPVFVDMIENATFPEHELELKKEQVAQQLSVQMQKVSFRADACLRKLICGASHPLAIVNTPQQVMDLRREELAHLFQRIRQPRFTHLFVGGSLTPQVVDTVYSAIGSLAPSGVEPLEVAIVPLAPESPCTEKIEVPDALQSAVCMGMPLVDRHHPDYPLLQVAAIALGGYFGSRLMMNLREDKGYTYGVNASLLGVHEGSWLRISFECSHEHVNAAIAQVRLELERLVSDPPRGEELERMRRSALVSHLETLDSPLEIVAFYRNMLLSNLPVDYFEAKQNAILTVTPEDISRIAAKYLRPEYLRIAVAGR